MISSQTGQASERRSWLARLSIPPHRIRRTGDDAPAAGLLRYVWRMSGMHQAWVSLIAAFVAALAMAPLELQRRIVNDAVGDADIALLLTLGAVYLGVILVRSVAKFAMQAYQGWLSESAILYNRTHLARLQRTHGDPTGSGEQGEGRTVSIIGAEVEKLGGFVGEGISQPVVNVGMLLAILGYMLAVEPLVALVAMAFLLPQVFIVPWLQRIINRLIERRVGLMRAMSDSLVAENGNSSPDDVDDHLDSELHGIYRNRIRIYAVKFLMKGASNLLSGLAPLTVLLVGGYFVIRDETTIGVVVAFITGFERLANPLRELLAYYRLAAQAVVQHDMIARWMIRTIGPDNGDRSFRQGAVDAVRDEELGSDDPLADR